MDYNDNKEPKTPGKVTLSCCDFVLEVWVPRADTLVRWWWWVRPRGRSNSAPRIIILVVATSHRQPTVRTQSPEHGAPAPGGTLLAGLRMFY